MLAKNENGYLYQEDKGNAPAGMEPTADDVIAAVCQDPDGVAVQLIQGSGPDDRSSVSVAGAEVGIETNPSNMYLYLRGDCAQVLYPYIMKYKNAILDYMEGRLEDEPYILLSFVPKAYDGRWFLGCSSPDACFAIADGIGQKADGLCVIFSPDSVGIFESEDTGEDETEEDPDDIDPDADDPFDAVPSGEEELG